MNRHAQCGRPHSRIILALTSIVFAAMLGNAEDAHCQDEKKLGWFSTAEFTAIWTGGNSESSTFGLTGTLHRAWTKSDFKFRFGGSAGLVEVVLNSFKSIRVFSSQVGDNVAPPVTLQAGDSESDEDRLGYSATDGSRFRWPSE